MKKNADVITETDLENYKDYLISKALAEKTVEKYLYDARVFGRYLKNKEITPKVLEDFKKKQLEKFTVVGARGLIFGVNSYLEYIDCPYKIEQIEPVKQKRDISKTAITKEEYLNILKAIKRSGNDRLYLIVESISGAGLKLSELQYLTVEAVIKSRVELPTNHRSIYLPKNLRDDLLEYCKDNDIFIGAILVTKSGKVPDKANISRELKKICADAGVDPERLSTKTLRDYYLKNFEEHRSDIVEMMDQEWRKKAAI
ncbi:MAG: hypothetical protein K2K41_04305 [Ruminiclostridium sp.]|nr:hypothetical protein [Ruminiclostridium sp.]